MLGLLHIEEEVLGHRIVCFCSDLEAALEHGDVDSGIEHVRGLPCQVRAGEPVRIMVCALSASDEISGRR